jgi:aspartate oxidase
MGGVVIDLDCRVVDRQQRAIPGLYAAGELTGLAGINGKAGLEGTFLGPSILTGRIAGRTAAGDRRQPRTTTPSAGRTSDGRAAFALSSDQASPGCVACHDLPRLITAARPGFRHFEQVHRRVLDRRLDCGSCHAALAQAGAPHRVHPLAQAATCATCHGSAAP